MNAEERAFLAAVAEEMCDTEIPPGECSTFSNAGRTNYRGHDWEWYARSDIADWLKRADEGDLMVIREGQGGTADD